jgi:hypothetical protein
MTHDRGVNETEGLETQFLIGKITELSRQTKELDADLDAMMATLQEATNTIVLLVDEVAMMGHRIRVLERKIRES